MKTETINIEQIAKRIGFTPEQVQAIIDKAHKAMKPLTKHLLVKEGGKVHNLETTRTGVGIIDTDHGKLWEYSFHIDDQWQDYIVIWKGEVDDDMLPIFDMDTLVIRTDSGCETGQVMGDKTCDCREQLHMAMDEISREDSGMIVHIPRQDGRGMGTPFKLGTLYLQDLLNVDTIESATILANGEEFDIRTYAGAIAILRFFGITNETKIQLATNNPRKLTVFVENGYEIVGLRSVVAPPTKQTERHLRAKQEKLGHINLIKENPDESSAAAD